MQSEQGISSLPPSPVTSLEEVRFQNWQKILSLIQKELSERSYQTWFEGVRCLSLGPDEVVVAVPDPFYGNWLKEHYDDLIEVSAQEVLGARPRVIYRVLTPAHSPSLSTLRAPQETVGARDLGLNPNYSFENFVVGPGNRFAHAAALAVTEAPAKHYNPLFIYGRVGLGKTHLLQAIALETKRRSPEKKILYLSSEKFTNHLIVAIQTRSTQVFRNRFRNVDLLLIDDIPFVAGKESSQEEFFHTFNTLYDAHKQIVLSSDRPPREIPSLEERLVSRFVWGLVTDIQAPDFETRLAILKKKLEREAIRVPDDVLTFIAQKFQSNIRELEGALIRVVAYGSLSGTVITLSLAERVLAGSLQEERKKIAVEVVQQVVAEVYGLKVADLCARRRTRSVALARQVAMYLARKLGNCSLVEIGGYFGGRDHTTVLHACRQIDQQLKLDEELRVFLGKVEGRLCV